MRWVWELLLTFVMPRWVKLSMGQCYALAFSFSIWQSNMGNWIAMYFLGKFWGYVYLLEGFIASLEGNLLWLFLGIFSEVCLLGVWGNLFGNVVKFSMSFCDFLKSIFGNSLGKYFHGKFWWYVFIFLRFHWKLLGKIVMIFCAILRKITEFII